MKNEYWSRLGLSLILIGSMTTQVLAQDTSDAQPKASSEDIQIVDRDGKSGTLRIMKRVDGGPGQAVARVRGDGGVTITNENGKITITDANGEQQVVEVPGANSVAITQSSKTVDVDGETKTENYSKAIIIGPDGKQHEILLSGPVAAGQLSAAINLDLADVDKFMIGVVCEQVPESLSAQLKLATGVGLLVEHVTAGKPADKAGLLKHDILMYADDADLKTTNDLIAAVQQAGRDKKTLALTVLRAGKEIGVEVMPVERPAIAGLKTRVRGDGSPQTGKLLQLVPGMIDADMDFDFDMQHAGPGVIIGPDFKGNEVQQKMQEQMKEMKAEFEQMRKQFEDLKGGRE